MSLRQAIGSEVWREPWTLLVWLCYGYDLRGGPLKIKEDTVGMTYLLPNEDLNISDQSNRGAFLCRQEIFLCKACLLPQAFLPIPRTKYKKTISAGREDPREKKPPKRAQG